MKEYYYNPAAPKPQRIISTVEASVVNGKGEILMMQKKGESEWTLPKSEAKIGYSLESSAMILFEGQGLAIETADIIALYSNPNIIFEDEERGLAWQEVVTLFYMKEMFGVLPADTGDVSWRWVSLGEVNSVAMPCSVRLHMRDVIGYATKRKKNIRANDGDHDYGFSCYCLGEKHMAEQMNACFIRRNAKTMFVDIKEMKSILSLCENESEKEKTIKNWCAARFPLVLDNLDFSFGDEELQEIVLHVISTRKKRNKVTETLTYRDIHENKNNINDELYMLLATSFYKAINNDYDLHSMIKFLTRYCH